MQLWTSTQPVVFLKHESRNNLRWSRLCRCCGNRIPAVLYLDADKQSNQRNPYAQQVDFPFMLERHTGVVAGFSVEKGDSELHLDQTGKLRRRDRVAEVVALRLVAILTFKKF
jgi:hypothetical protein